MKLNPLAWVAIAIGAFYLLSKSKLAGTVVPASGNAVASTVSPAGSTSGILTPITGGLSSVSNLLLEAFTPSPTGQAGINASISATPVTAPLTYGPSDAQLGISTGSNTPPDIQDTSLLAGSGSDILDISGSDFLTGDMDNSDLSYDEDSSGDILS